MDHNINFSFIYGRECNFLLFYYVVASVVYLAVFRLCCAPSTAASSHSGSLTSGLYLTMPSFEYLLYTFLSKNSPSGGGYSESLRFFCAGVNVIRKQMPLPSGLCATFACIMQKSANGTNVSRGSSPAAIISQGLVYEQSPSTLHLPPASLSFIAGAGGMHN